MAHHTSVCLYRHQYIYTEYYGVAVFELRNSSERGGDQGQHYNATFSRISSTERRGGHGQHYSTKLQAIIILCTATHTKEYRGCTDRNNQSIIIVGTTSLSLSSVNKQQNKCTHPYTQGTPGVRMYIYLCQSLVKYSVSVCMMPVHCCTDF